MSKALVPIAAMAPATSRWPRLASAPFLAHLIATARQAPQTRARRRADPGEAVAVYAALERPPAAMGRMLSCAL